METKKVRLDYTAHISVVVEVPNDEDWFDNAISVAADYLYGYRGVKAKPMWELDDGGVEEVGKEEEAINRTNDMF